MTCYCLMKMYCESVAGTMSDLLSASYQGQLEQVQRLLAAGADVNMKGPVPTRNAPPLTAFYTARLDTATLGCQEWSHPRGASAGGGGGPRRRHNPWGNISACAGRCGVCDALTLCLCLP